MPRYEWGPAQDRWNESADLVFSLKAIRRGGLVDITVAEVDPELNLKPTAIHALYLPEKPAPEVTPEAALKSCALQGSIAGDALAVGDHTITVPGPIPSGRYYVATVLEFAE